MILDSWTGFPLPSPVQIRAAANGRPFCTALPCQLWLATGSFRLPSASSFAMAFQP